jgi:NAD(P)-dependent dehydrogenase (short-subunit alcohol dehydrogenase family)
VSGDSSGSPPLGLTADISGKVALITGSASGIGRATAQLFARQGARVVVADSDLEGGRDTVSAIRAAGAEAIFIAVDVGREQDVADMIAQTLSRFGGLDVLHNNAAVFRVGASFDQWRLEDWDRTMRVNATGVFLGCKHGIAAMRGLGRGGRIINTVTVLPGDGGRWDPEWGACPDYAASKGAIVGLTPRVGAIGAPYGIYANCVAPNGPVNTQMQQHTSRQMREALRAHLLEPEAVAVAAVFLATATFSGAIVAVSPGSDGHPVYEMTHTYQTTRIHLDCVVPTETATTT